MVSTDVDTAEPADALEWPLAASELVARLRAESAAIVAAFEFGDRSRAETGDAQIGRLRSARICARRGDIEVAHRRGILPIARRHLHDDMILVERAIDRRHLALAKGVIKRIVDGAQSQSETLGRRPINHDVGFEAGLLLVRIDVFEMSDPCSASVSRGAHL